MDPVEINFECLRLAVDAAHNQVFATSAERSTFILALADKFAVFALGRRELISRAMLTQLANHDAPPN